METLTFRDDPAIYLPGRVVDDPLVAAARQNLRRCGASAGKIEQCYSGGMPLSGQHRHALLLADRTHDVGAITTVVAEVPAANPETKLLENFGTARQRLIWSPPATGLRSCSV